MLRSSCVFSMLVVACSAPSSPTGYYPAPPAPASQIVHGPPGATLASTPAPAPAPAPAQQPAPPPAGVVRIDGRSTYCEQIVAVDADGGATLLCTFGREQGCGLRHVGPDGEERGRSELAPGSCARWVARPGGGGVLITKQERQLAFTALDAAGRRGASTALTSKSGIYAEDAIVAPDGGVFAALTFYGDLAHRGKRLGKSEFGVRALVRLPASLDRLAWSRLFGTRRTEIAGLVPSTKPHGVDAILETRGPLVPGGPMNPPENPADGSVFGGDTYGWRAEQVSFDRHGRPGARQELATGPYRSIFEATVVEGVLALLGPNKVTQKGNAITLRRTAGEPAHIPVGFGGGMRIVNGRTWVIAYEYAQVDGKHVTTSSAREVGGAGRTIALAQAWRGKPVQWSAVAVDGDRVVALGTTEEPASGVQLTFTALGRVPATTAALDLAGLTVIDRLAIPEACRGKRSKLTEQIARVHQSDAELEACGVARGVRAELASHPEGGIRTFAITGASSATTTCARTVIEPMFLCPPEHAGGSTSFVLRR